MSSVRSVDFGRGIRYDLSGAGVLRRWSVRIAGDTSDFAGLFVSSSRVRIADELSCLFGVVRVWVRDLRSLGGKLAGLMIISRVKEGEGENKLGFLRRTT